jgi:hypothetical protein
MKSKPQGQQGTKTKKVCEGKVVSLKTTYKISADGESISMSDEALDASHAVGTMECQERALIILRPEALVTKLNRARLNVRDKNSEIQSSSLLPRLGTDLKADEQHSFLREVDICLLC